MFLIAIRDEQKEERKKIYFDLMCGLISAILALTGIITTAIIYGITRWAGFFTGLTFWLLYLSLSMFLLGFGLYSKRQEKKYGVGGKRKKEIRAPMVS